MNDIKPSAQAEPQISTDSNSSTNGSTNGSRKILCYFDGACGPLNPGGDIGLGVVVYDVTHMDFYFNKGGLQVSPNPDWNELFNSLPYGDCGFSMIDFYTLYDTKTYRVTKLYNFT